MALVRLSIATAVAGALLAGTFSTAPALAESPSGAAAAALAAAPPDPRPIAQVRFTIGTHNVKRSTGTLTRFADVIGWQELDKPVGWKAARALAGYQSYLPDADPAKEDTISWKSAEFALVSAHSRMTHHGEAKVTPNRYVNWVVLRHRATGLTFAFVNTHFISGAWNKHPNRQQRWLVHQKVLQDVVAGLRKQGLPVVVVGDMNRQTSLGLAGTERIPVATGDATPIDQLYVTKGDAVGKATRLDTWGSDHHAYRATVAMRLPQKIAGVEHDQGPLPATPASPANPATPTGPTAAPAAQFLSLLTTLIALLQSLQHSHA